jgi:hypothetical protein
LELFKPEELYQDPNKLVVKLMSAELLSIEDELFEPE